MMPFLTSTGALFALLAVPVLVAIYLFQRRFRVREVSSLILWDAVNPASVGGRTREPLRLPLVFWLELLAIVLLVLAAAGPLLPQWSRSQPLVIVLDDSLSMRAGRSAPREQALRFVHELTESGAHEPVHIVFAGATPQLAGGKTAEERLRGWTCEAASADLDAAIGFAAQLGGPGALVQVITDRAPATPLERGRLAWRAFGAPASNVGFVAAARGSGKRDRVLLEIASYAATPQRRTLTMQRGETLVLDLSPFERRRLELSAIPETPFEARLSGDDASFDDHVLLLPEARPPIRVALQIASVPLRREVESALRATGRVAITALPPELIVTDGAASGAGRSVVIDAAVAENAVIGPYVVDRMHPLMRGLTLDGVIWAARAGGAPMAGDPLVLVGTRTLMSVENVAEGERLNMRLDVARSNVARSTLWPALWWNVLEWAADARPGVRAANVTLGSDARVTVDAARVLVSAPDGSRRQVDAVDGMVVIQAQQPGVWSVGRTRFAVNAIVPAESDLRGRVAGTWGGWSEESMLASGYENVAWIALLLAIAVLVWHHWTLWAAVPAADVRGAS